jgi:tRNA threonylcarbamoyladenosine biosynthesis protein TsaB
VSEETAQERNWLLALDTSTDWAGVALTDGVESAELNWTAGRQQTTQVMPEVQRLLGSMQITPNSLGALAVAIGPGSFSGIRVGMAIANGISVASGIPIIGVSTLELTIHGWDGVSGPAVGVIRAGRSRYGWASADDIANPTSGSVAELIDYVRVGKHRIVLGELSDEDAIRMRETSGAIVPPAPVRLRRSGTLARLGWERWRAGDFDPAASHEPIYLHRR